MTIKVRAGIPSASLVYDNILITNFSMEQEPSSDNVNVSPISITIQYKLYAIDTGNVRVFNGKVHEVEVFNYMQEGASKVGPNGILMRAMLPALERMVSIIITDKGTTGNTEVL